MHTNKTTINKMQRYSPTHSGDLGLRYPPETSVEIQMLPAGKELVDGIKLRAVAHVLVHVQDLGHNATKQDKRHLSLSK